MRLPGIVAESPVTTSVCLYQDAGELAIAFTHPFPRSFRAGFVILSGEVPEKTSLLPQVLPPWGQGVRGAHCGLRLAQPQPLPCP